MQIQWFTSFYYRYPSHFGKFKYPEDGLVVCGTPLYGNFSNTLRLVEYIEIYRKMGAKKFYIYNDSSTKNVSKVLNYYEDEGIVKVLDWQMDRGICRQAIYGLNLIYDDSMKKDSKNITQFAIQFQSIIMTKSLGLVDCLLLTTTVSCERMSLTTWNILWWPILMKFWWLFVKTKVYWISSRGKTKIQLTNLFFCIRMSCQDLSKTFPRSLETQVISWAQ